MRANTKLQIFLLLWLSSSACASAQGFFGRIQDRWSKRSKAEEKIGIDGGFESRSSFIRFQPVSLYAVKGGISFQNRAYFYLGYHWLATPVYNLVRTPLPNGGDSLVRGQLRLNYFSQSVELVCYRNDHWRISVPFLVGLGMKRYTDLNTLPGNLHNLSSGRFIPFEMSVSATYKAFRWLGVGGSLGYRTSLLQPRGAVGQDYRGITYSMGFSVYLKPLYQVLKESMTKPDPKKKPASKKPAPKR